MDYLILVGRADFAGPALLQRLRYTPLDQMTNWLDWLNRILGPSIQATDLRGEIVYSNEAGGLMRIPYRKFAVEGAAMGEAAACWTEFPVD